MIHSKKILFFEIIFVSYLVLRILFSFRSFLLLSWLLPTAPVLAVEFELQLGLASDSAAALEELVPNASNATGRDDIVGSLELNATHQVNENISVGADAMTEHYSSFDENNSTSLGVNGQLSYDMDTLSLSVDGHVMSITLDGDDFLDLTMVTPALGYLNDAGLYASLSATGMNKGFKTMPDFDADQLSVSAMGIFFFNNFKSNVMLRLSDAEEDAGNNIYDYEESTYSLSTTLPLDVGPRGSRLKLTYENRDRDYIKAVDAGQKTNEARDRGRIILDTSLTKNLTLRSEYDYKDRKSNLPQATYDSSELSLKLIYRQD